MSIIQWAMFCNDFELDEHRRPNLLGLLNEIQAKRFPCSHPRLFIAAHFLGTPNEIVAVEVAGYRPDGAQMGKTVCPQLPLSDVGSAYFVHGLKSLTLPFPGMYRFEVTTPNNPPYRLDLHVLQAIFDASGATR